MAIIAITQRAVMARTLANTAGPVPQTAGSTAALARVIGVAQIVPPARAVGKETRVRTRQVARNSLVVSMVHALPTAAVTAAFVRMDGVAQIVIMQLDAMAILVVNTAPALPMVANTHVPAPMDMMGMRANTNACNAAANAIASRSAPAAGTIRTAARAAHTAIAAPATSAPSAAIATAHGVILIVNGGGLVSVCGSAVATSISQFKV